MLLQWVINVQHCNRVSHLVPSGNNSKYYASAPQIYKTKTDVHPASAMGMIAGMCGAAVLGAVLAVTLWMKFRERRYCGFVCLCV